MVKALHEGSFLLVSQVESHAKTVNRNFIQRLCSELRSHLKNGGYEEIFKFYLPFKAACEFLERNNGITVFVKLGEEVDYVLLERGVVLGWLLDLVDDVLNGSFGELVGVVVHVFFGVVISRQKLELESTEEASAADKEVLLRVVGLGDGAEMLLALHEFASNSSGVLVTDFVDLDGVVTTEEGDNELSGFIIRLGGDQLGVEAEDVHVLLEHLFHIGLGSLSSEVENTVHGVFLSSVSSVRRDGLVD